jgi:hypothetical protein
VNTTGRTIIPFQQFALIAPDSIEVVCRLVSVSLLDQVENPIGSVHNDLILAARASTGESASWAHDGCHSPIYGALATSIRVRSRTRW